MPSVNLLASMHTNPQQCVHEGRTSAAFLLLSQAGLARFPQNAHMVLVYVNFLGSVVNSQQACSSQLQATKKLDPNWLDRCGAAGIAERCLSCMMLVAVQWRCRVLQLTNSTDSVHVPGVPAESG